jgi:hypothetical protein
MQLTPKQKEITLRWLKISDLRAAAESKLLGVPGKYTNRWFQLSGDVNPLDYGAKYARFDQGGRWEVREIDRYEEGSEHTYAVCGFSGDIIDLCDEVHYLSYSGIESNKQWANLSSMVSELVDAYTAYGHGNHDNECGNNAQSLLGFYHQRPYLPTDFIELEVGSTTPL